MIFKTNPASKLIHGYPLKKKSEKITSPKDAEAANVSHNLEPAERNPEPFYFRKVPTGVTPPGGNETPYLGHDDCEKIEFMMDQEVKKALDNYQTAINRYNYADLSDPRVENVYFLERQVTFINLQLALAKARMRNGKEPRLDYTNFENLLKLVGMGGEK